MRYRLWLLPLAVAVLTAVPALAEHPKQPVTNTGNPNFNFIPGFGLQPVVRESFPTPGFGFDITHHHLLHRRRFFPGGFVGGGFFGPNFAVGGFFPFPVVGSSSSVVIVQQPAQPQVVIIGNPYGTTEAPVAVAPGLPEDWPRLRIAASSYPREQQPLPALTLLVLKNEKIFAVKDYWLEDDLIFYVTSSGRQGSFPLRDLDWEMTTRLNAQRGYDFVLELPRE